MTRPEAVGAVVGAAVALAWATSLRAWMVHLAMEFGDRPRLTWAGTFGSVLLPAVVVGTLIGLDWRRRRLGRPGVPGVAWSPVLLVLGPALVADDFVTTLLETGEGGGAIAVVVVGTCGGAVLAGRGPVWARASAGVLAVGVAAAMVVALYVRGRAVMASGVFGAVHLLVLLGWLALACSLPLRPAVAAHTGPTTAKGSGRDGTSAVGVEAGGEPGRVTGANVRRSW